MSSHLLHDSPSAVPALGRIMIAIIFLFSGIEKVLDPGHTIEAIRSVGLPFAHLGLAIAVLLGLGGGAMLVLGIRTRMVALVLAVYCLVAGLIFHSPFDGIAQAIQLAKNIAIAGGLLQVAAFGAGRYAVDRMPSGRETIHRA